MLAIHNLMHQGAQDPALFPMLGLAEEHYPLFDFPENNVVFNTPPVAAGGQSTDATLDNGWGQW